MEDDQAPQADGYYPRLNAGMVRSGQFNQKIVSLVGHFESNNSSFKCCDGNSVAISTEHVELPHIDPNTVVEVVGQVSTPELVAVFVVREFSPDMNLEIYNKMIAVQHNPKFAEYFAPVL